MYKSDDARGQVDTFIKTSNQKIKTKFDFILRYIADEKNQFKEPYVKHFSIEKYKRLYELRLKAAGTMVRIIFYSIEENIILLNAFIKRDKRDTEQALEYALKLIERLDRSAETPVDYLSEVDVN
jgi:hypothetical protein